MNNDSLAWRWTWFLALGGFILAAATGVLLRFGVLHGFPAGLQYINVRHAHSHLMYFGWVTPALMGLIAAWLPRLTGRPVSRRFKGVILTAAGAAVLAYAAFLPYGYQSAEIGGRRLPLSVIAASLNMLVWYAFMLLYYRSSRGTPRVRPLRYFDLALGFQFLASLGAWGVAVVSRLAISDPFWSTAMTHLFLDLFSEGWFVLAVFALVYVNFPQLESRTADWGEQLLVIGLPLTFLLAMPVNLVPSGLRVIAGIGGLLVVIGTLANVYVLWPLLVGRLASWRLPLLLLALKAAISLAVVFPAAARWVEQNRMRILYLHLLLLGFVTLGLVNGAADRWGDGLVRGRRWLAGAVLFLLLTLIPLTGLWPAAWGGRWVMQLAAWATLGPLAGVIWLLANRLRIEKAAADV